MNETKLLKSHRSIKSLRIKKSIKFIEQILSAGQAAASSSFLQGF